MSTSAEDLNEIYARAADERRLHVTEGILHDLFMAAQDVIEGRDRRGWSGAREKRDYWDAVHRSVETEHDAASVAYDQAARRGIERSR
ncbi:hypothetical protein [Nocardia seriolae]|uniref:Uncharacterized protein n=1 Tax=Nocardia seriolae TaxID=37332 RepID=A0A0B8NQQ7_9NOCA|nr:hypothetical protein [Nocardia seriolae]APA97596.1 hypothetical protein NS506_03544 [Nocardia seriolae]MTJ62481.1 hypothetical protein [Nocardia seriolae]MTJ75507.1 hypothetical protein [Nocardia seriolae]MTJ87382.1 hypothetical protein [Nocardia seriolae]MTK31374.1 hypothetical protein [Nocardia seriolae]